MLKVQLDLYYVNSKGQTARMWTPDNLTVEQATLLLHRYSGFPEFISASLKVTPRTEAVQPVAAGETP